jgi:hypothetical protein
MTLTIPTIRVTGTFVSSTGLPARRFAKFTPSYNVLRDTTGRVIASPTAIQVTPDAAGYIAVDLTATNYPGVDPANFVWHVEEPTGRSYNLSLDYATAGGTLDLVDIVSATSGATGQTTVIARRIRDSIDYDNSVAPTDGQAITWDAAGGHFKPGGVLGGIGTTLADRAIFGAYANTGGTAQLSALETALGVRLPRYVTYQTMATGGTSGWPTADAAWCKATGHELVIAWDILSGGPTFANILSGGNNASLDAFFTAAKNYGGPVTLRMWWEMNDVNGPTKVDNASSTLFASSTVSARRTQWIAAWQYVYNRCKTTIGADNVDFFFCANGSDTGATTIEQLWPGTAYVDVIGLDTYNETTFASWTGFSAKISPMMTRLAALAPDLPQGIGELGTVDTGGPGGTSKATWLQDLFATTDWPKLKFVDFFSVNQTNDWRLDQTRAASPLSRRG